MDDLARRLSNRVQLTTDGHRVYLDAVESAFGSEIDYSMLVKIYENDAPDTRYSPPSASPAKKSELSDDRTQSIFPQATWSGKT